MAEQLISPATFNGLATVQPRFAGDYLCAPGYATAGYGLAAGALVVSALQLPAGRVLTRLACEVTTVGGAGALIRLGIYSDQGGRPGARVVDGGTVVGDSGAVAKEVTISYTVPTTGWYWLAACGEVATTTLRAHNVIGGAGADINDVFGVSPKGMCGLATFGGVAAGGLPANFPTFSFAQQVPKVAVKIT